MHLNQMHRKSFTNHSPLLVNKYSKVLENFIYFTNLMLYFLYTLIPFLYNGLIEGDLIIQ